MYPCIMVATKSSLSGTITLSCAARNRSSYHSAHNWLESTHTKLCHLGSHYWSNFSRDIINPRNSRREHSIKETEQTPMLHRFFNISTEAMKTARLLAVIPLLLIARQLSGETSSLLIIVYEQLLLDLSTNLGALR